MLAAVAAVAAVACVPRYGPGDHEVQLGARAFRLFVPPSGGGGPGLVHIHGCGVLLTTRGFVADGPAYEAALTHINVTAGARGWSVAHPYGLPAAAGGCPNPGGARYQPLGFNAGGCCGNVTADDVGFMKAVAEFFVTEQCVPRGGVYAAGFSTGAMMAQRLACEAPGVFNGLAAVEGSLMYGGDFAACAPNTTTNLLMVCGGDDPVCHPAFAKDTAFWRGAMGCASTATPTLTTATTRCLRNTACAAGGALEVCTVARLSHCWPGGDPALRLGICPKEPASDVDASDYILSVFAGWEARRLEDTR